ncbi:MFS transporter [Gilbertella persicaria]|nr:MFS transporter [Gilbertella persicaria]KAI8077242.1 MFS transporter [Gilbertella persicaria]
MHNIEFNNKKHFEPKDFDTLEAPSSSAITIVQASDTASQQESSHHEPYSVFTKNQKIMIVLTASISSFFSPFSANIYFPALTLIQDDMHITERLVSTTVTGYMIFQGISPSFWGSLADSWGRRPVFVSTFLVYALACIGLANTKNYATLLSLRMLQAFGSSSAIAVGAGTIGDIASPMERGGYMGIFTMGSMLGNCLGPPLGMTILIMFLRWIFWVLSLMAILLWIVQIFFLPETLRSLVGNGSDSGILQHSSEETLSEKQVQKSRYWNFPNPLQSVYYLKEKDVFALLLYNSIQYASLYCVLTSLTGLFTDIYQLNVFQIGLCFLSNGLGAMIGSFTSGRILNYKFKKMAKSLNISEEFIKREKIDPEFPIEKARMGVTWIWGIAFNIFMIVYGWCLQQQVHMAIPIVINFLMSYCSTCIHNSTNTLLVDLFPHNSAAIIASSNLTRCLLGAGAVMMVEPAVAAMGVGWFFTMVSFVLLLSRTTVIVLLKFGPKWRLERFHQSQ